MFSSGALTRKLRVTGWAALNATLLDWFAVIVHVRVVIRVKVAPLTVQIAGMSLLSRRACAATVPKVKAVVKGELRDRLAEEGGEGVLNPVNDGFNDLQDDDEGDDKADDDPQKEKRELILEQDRAGCPPLAVPKR